MDSQRHQQNLQGVLRFAIENSACEDGLDPSSTDQMGQERKEFLENALKSMTVDVIEELEKAIQTLQSNTAKVEEKIEALNVIRDYAGSIDFANNFITIGGSKVVLDCLKNRNPKLKICAAYVIAELSQNNPFSQQHFLDADALDLLIMYTKEDGDVASSSMHAISSLVRNFENGCAKFVEIGGLECILERLQSLHSNVFVKSCFLLRALAAEHIAIRDKFVRLGAVTALTASLDSVVGFDVKIEIILSALEVLTHTQDGILQLERANIREIFQSLIELNAGKAECEEILKDSSALLDRLDQIN